MRRKITVTLFAIMLCTAMCINVSASNDYYTYTVGNKTIIFNSDTAFNAETREYVVNYLMHGKPQSTTYGLVCTLLGHSYETSLVTTITHCASDTNPRCLEETYKVQICKRCDHDITELVNVCYISCCPEE